MRIFRDYKNKRVLKLDTLGFARLAISLRSHWQNGISQPFAYELTDFLNDFLAQDLPRSSQHLSNLPGLIAFLQGLLQEKKHACRYQIYTNGKSVWQVHLVGTGEQQHLLTLDKITCIVYLKYYQAYTANLVSKIDMQNDWESWAHVMSVCHVAGLLTQDLIMRLVEQPSLREFSETVDQLLKHSEMPDAVKPRILHAKNPGGQLQAYRRLIQAPSLTQTELFRVAGFFDYDFLKCEALLKFAEEMNYHFYPELYSCILDFRDIAQAIYAFSQADVRDPAFYVFELRGHYSPCEYVRLIVDMFSQTTVTIRDAFILTAAGDFKFDKPDRVRHFVNCNIPAELFTKAHYSTESTLDDLIFLLQKDMAYKEIAQQASTLTVKYLTYPETETTKRFLDIVEKAYSLTKRNQQVSVYKFLLNLSQDDAALQRIHRVLTHLYKGVTDEFALDNDILQNVLADKLEQSKVDQFIVQRVSPDSMRFLNPANRVVALFKSKFLYEPKHFVPRAHCPPPHSITQTYAKVRS